MIKELIIKGDFTVEGLPPKISANLEYLKLKAEVMPVAIIQVDEFHSKKGGGKSITHTKI